MSDMDLSKTMGYDVLCRDGAKVLKKTLLAADRELTDGDIQRDLDQLVNEMAKGIHLGGGKMTETMGLVRLVGYLQEMAKVLCMLPAFGFSFQTDDCGRLAMVFDPRRLGLDSVPAQPPAGLAKVGS
jgi:hypothetical protein